MFKFPMLFGRIPKHKRFHYEPRYFDAQQEERKARQSRIEMELGQQPDQDEVDHRERMSSAFGTRRKQRKPMSGDMKETILQLALILAMALLLIAWLEWGNVVFYSLLLVVPVWFYVRFLRKRSS